MAGRPILSHQKVGDREHQQDVGDDFAKTDIVAAA